MEHIFHQFGLIQSHLYFQGICATLCDNFETK